MKQFYIHESNIDRLRKKVNRVRNKCQKYGCDFHYEEVGSEVKQIERDGKVIDTKYIIVEAEGRAQINGWDFVASIDHTEAGNIVKTTSDIRIPPRYFKCGPECEHCNSNRHRKNTYLIHNINTDEFKQVGSGCLFDYTGGLSAEYAAEYVSMFDEMIKGEAPVHGCDFKTYYNLQQVLEFAQEFIQVQGYISSDAWGLTTRDVTHIALNYDRGTADRYDTDIMTNWINRNGWDPARNTEYVKSAIAWVIDNIDDDSAYFNNIKVICKLGYVERVQIGYAVSILPTYYRYLKNQEMIAAREARQTLERRSEFVGEVGTKVEVLKPTVEPICSWDTEWGSTTRYKITDEDGNIYMWDTSSWIDSHKSIESIKGTVKKHDTYREVKQTWLTRCKITYSEPVSDSETAYENETQKAIYEFLEMADQ